MESPLAPANSAFSCFFLNNDTWPLPDKDHWESQALSEASALAAQH